MKVTKTGITIQVLTVDMKAREIRQLPRPSIYPEDMERFTPICWCDAKTITKDTWATRAIIGEFDGVVVCLMRQHSDGLAQFGKTTIRWHPLDVDIPFALIR